MYLTLLVCAGHHCSRLSPNRMLHFCVCHQQGRHQIGRPAAKRASGRHLQKLSGGMHAKALIIPRISHGPAHDSSALSYCAVTIMSVLSSLSSREVPPCGWSMGAVRLCSNTLSCSLVSLGSLPQSFLKDWVPRQLDLPFLALLAPTLGHHLTIPTQSNCEERP